MRMLKMGISGLLDHLIVFIFVVVYPSWAGYRFLQVKRGSKTLPVAYLEAAVGQWLVTLLVLAWIGVSGRVMADIGLRLDYTWSMIISLIVTAGGMAFFVIQAWTLTRSEDTRQEVRRQVKKVSPIMPRTMPQLGGFLLLAISAGICEEILFRGFLIDYLDRYFSLVTAFLGSSIIFGLAHAYQGPKGMLQAAVAGAVFAGLYLFSGSLLAPILLHIVVDIHGGWAGYYVSRASARD
ncbi:MAG: CPBP family intramembrane metalloprotease [Pseudomonadales bacterium]|nr:CPBP family intramembrane metalloprotease [Pseudomonadales bacterium]